jgi:protease IV
MKEYFVWLLKILTVFVLFFVVMPAIIAASARLAMNADGNANEGDVVAVVELNGEILDTKEVVKQLYDQSTKNNVRGIVLRIDSPGGAVGPSQEVYHAVEAIKKVKPVVVSMGSVAASGGLYAALSASKIFANEGTLTGSIGVIGQFPNFSTIADRVGVEVITVKSGKLKDIGNPFRPMEEADRAFLADTMTEIHDQFIKAVAVSRSLDESVVREFADGRVLTGYQAKARGLVDEIGGLHEAARAVYEELEKPLPAGTYPRLFYPEGKLSQLKDILTGVKNVLENISFLSMREGIYYRSQL